MIPRKIWQFKTLDPDKTMVMGFTARQWDEALTGNMQAKLDEQKRLLDEIKTAEVAINKLIDESEKKDSNET